MPNVGTEKCKNAECPKEDYTGDDEQFFSHVFHDSKFMLS